MEVIDADEVLERIHVDLVGQKDTDGSFGFRLIASFPARNGRDRYQNCRCAFRARYEWLGNRRELGKHADNSCNTSLAGPLGSSVT